MESSLETNRPRLLRIKSVKNKLMAVESSELITKIGLSIEKIQLHPEKLILPWDVARTEAFFNTFVQFISHVFSDDNSIRHVSYGFQFQDLRDAEKTFKEKLLEIDAEMKKSNSIYDGIDSILQSISCGFDGRGRC